MFPFQKHTKLNTLEEDFKALGLDPESSLQTIDRQTRLVEERVGVPSEGRKPASGSPPVTTPTSLHEDFQTPGFGEQEPDNVQEAGDLGYEPLVDLTDIPEANREEALRAVKKKIRTAGEKLKARRKRKKFKAQSRRSARAYRKRNKRKIARRQRIKLKKFGRAGLAKLHKMGKRVVTASVDADDELSQLREEISGSVSGGLSSDYQGPFEEAAYNAGLLSMMIGEIAEAIGDEATAEALYSLSDRASDLSEELEGTMDESDLSEAQADDLKRIIESMTKGIRYYEKLGAPSLSEAFEFGEENGLQG